MIGDKVWNFTISDLARFLGKSSVTLREWEKKGFITFPRNDVGDRKLLPKDITEIADFAFDNGRIKKDRRDIIRSIITMIEILENNG